MDLPREECINCCLVLFSTECIYKIKIIWAEYVIFRNIKYAQIHEITISKKKNKKTTNLKECEKGFIGGLGERKGREEMF